MQNGSKHYMHLIYSYFLCVCNFDSSLTVAVSEAKPSEHGGTVSKASVCFMDTLRPAMRFLWPSVVKIPHKICVV